MKNSLINKSILVECEIDFMEINKNRFLALRVS